MRELKTIDTATVFKLAYSALLEHWCDEMERKARLADQGHASPISDARIAKYEMQLAELHDRIVEVEKK